MKRTVLSVLIVLAVIGTGLGCNVSADPTATPIVIVVTATPAPAATPPVLTKPTPTLTSAGKQQMIEARALWVLKRTEGSSGGTSPLKVSAEKNPGSKELRVGFFEEEAGGSGPMWRASGWMAVIMSSLLLGLDPTEYRFNYDVSGRIDGPSAGALMTVSTLASLLGDPLKAGVTMTGAINPDGTIGPVGGIPHKIDGAANAKLKVVLIPAGQRMDYDSNLKSNVDVVDLGRSKGIEVREVADIYQAYEIFTGRPLPKAPGMKDVRPVLPATAIERIRAKTKEWQNRWGQIDSQYSALPAAVKIEVCNNPMQRAKAISSRADSLSQQGQPSAAYTQAMAATLNASIGYNCAMLLDAWMKGGTKSAGAYLASLSPVRAKITTFVDRLQGQTPKSLGDIITVADAYGYANLAIGLIDLADYVRNRGETAEESIAALTEATLNYGLADHTIEFGKDMLDIGIGYGKVPLPAPEKIDGIAELLRRAADANLNYFNTVVLDEMAAETGVHPTVFKANFASKDTMYAFANLSINAIPRLKERAGGGLAGSSAVLGSAINSYVYSSILVAKYYSLGIRANKDGAITHVTDERGMNTMLEFAEKRSRELIGLCTALETEPVQPVLYFENALVSRQGEIADKLNSLQAYWRASLQGMILGMLSGKAKMVN